MRNEYDFTSAARGLFYRGSRGGRSGRGGDAGSRVTWRLHFDLEPGAAQDQSLDPGVAVVLDGIRCRVRLRPPELRYFVAAARPGGSRRRGRLASIRHAACALDAARRPRDADVRIDQLAIGTVAYLLGPIPLLLFDAARHPHGAPPALQGVLVPPGRVLRVYLSSGERWRRVEVDLAITLRVP